MEKPETVNRGDVFQITSATEGREGWLGALVMTTEVKPWGIQGFVHVIETHDTSACAYIRLKWEDIEYVGPAPLVPAN